MPVPLDARQREVDGGRRNKEGGVADVEHPREVPLVGQRTGDPADAVAANASMSSAR